MHKATHAQAQMYAYEEEDACTKPHTHRHKCMEVSVHSEKEQVDTTKKNSGNTNKKYTRTHKCMVVGVHAEKALVDARGVPSVMPLPPNLRLVIARHAHYRGVAGAILHRADPDGFLPRIPILH